MSKQLIIWYNPYTSHNQSTKMNRWYQKEIAHPKNVEAIFHKVRIIKRPPLTLHCPASDQDSFIHLWQRCILSCWYSALSCCLESLITPLSRRTVIWVESLKHLWQGHLGRFTPPSKQNLTSSFSKVHQMIPAGCFTIFCLCFQVLMWLHFSVNINISLTKNRT